MQVDNINRRKATLVEAERLWNNLLVGARPKDEESLANLDFDDIRATVDLLEEKKRAMRGLLDDKSRLARKD